MNKAYRVVFNKATGVWMAVSEIARGRGKGRSVVRPVGAALIASAALFSAPGAMAQVLIEQPDGGGPINIGSSVTGGSVSFSNVAGQNRRLTGIENGVGTTDAVTVNQLNGALTALGGRINSVTGAIVAPTYTLGADSKGGTTYSTVPGALGNLDDRIKGNTASIVNNTTDIANLTNGTAGMVQQATAGAEITVAKDTDGDAVNFGGKGADGSPITRKLTNVTAGTNATDAVNFSQLSDVKNTAEQAATKANNSVQYDAAGDTITLTNPATGTGPVQIKNVAAGTADTDAVNKSQLDSVKAVADTAVQYDSAAKNSVTLGNVGTPVKLSNVADGAVASDSKDAVNGGQLFDVKSTAEQAAKAAANSVQYDAAGNTITLTNPATGTGPVQIKNVAAGTDDTDAVNVKQLKDAGLVGSDGKLANVVTYDSDKKDSVTLGGLKDDGTGAMVPATAPVKLSNIANGVNANDAVNFSQLNGVGSALGGGAGFNNGVWTGPTYTFRNGDQSTTVGDALSKLDNRVFTLEGSSVGGGSAANDKFSGSGANNGNPGQKEEAVASGTYATASGANAVAKGQNSTATGANARATADNSVALGAGSIADTANTVSVGSVGNERAITNVAEGTNPTDAVNKAQMDRQIAGVQNSVGNLQNQVSQIDSKVNRVGAMNAAMSTMIASAAGLQTDNRMAIGTGLYRGETALAIGYQRKVGSRATVTIGGSTAGGKEYNVGVGAGFGW
ncbi:hemagglutinin family protein [Ralstonia insidiosa]|uniref:Hemagglutinin family protein n=1 Tax=Ralstonia insidiosa TaxID=190721 RepID=A0AAC9BEJ4_9RALS|nr:MULTISPECIES: ESPR-type extended signal peptide-containing protein [Ralstonia]ANH72726.1 hemagglutinin family protein [Ralstonia insidiosa]EPX95550.1 hypothetical protein C404_24520 [Ralstonia sp. AU12-08]MBY4707443.1 YadA-like family protein [Ralstonia insidiosa]GAQ28266.1 yadA-like protein [Ralstonia sp. NT80]